MGEEEEKGVAWSKDIYLTEKHEKLFVHGCRRSGIEVGDDLISSKGGCEELRSSSV